jgi:drug/metabolite transporter (DMT)-like permease
MGTPSTDQPLPRHKQHILLGIIFTILAALSFTLMSLIGKIIGDRTSTDTILFARFIISLILILPWVIKQPREIKNVSNPSKLIFRSLFTFFAFVCFFYSLKFIPLSDALLLNNTFPLFIPLVAWCMLGTKTPYKIWIGISIGFIGIAFVLNPNPKFFNPACLFALASGILASISIVIIRTLTKTASIVQILFYNFLLCSILSGIALPLHWKSFDQNVFFLLCGVGLFGAAYQLFSTLSFAKAPVRITSPLMFLCIIFGVIADFLFWNQIPPTLAWIGMALVILGGILTIYFGHTELKKEPK